MAFSLLNQNEFAHSIALASLFSSPAEKDRLVSDFALKTIAPNSPIFTLIMVQTGRLDAIFEANSANITTPLWKTHFAYIL